MYELNLKGSFKLLTLTKFLDISMRGFQSTVPRPVTLASPKNLIEMQIPSLHPSSVESETKNGALQGFLLILHFENHWLRQEVLKLVRTLALSVGSNTTGAWISPQAWVILVFKIFKDHRWSNMQTNLGTTKLDWD